MVFFGLYAKGHARGSNGGSFLVKLLFLTIVYGQISLNMHVRRRVRNNGIEL